ncbi:hypothetical protein [Solwaraspora sp. WMMA2101]|uniref:hypothetical protein n=1 Tax=Solwaraspora sp. WMMA2101 TaxID=3404124 RepID=UPI003B95516C
MRIVLIALAALLVGLLLLHLGGRASPSWMRNPSLQALLENVGGLLVASVCLGALWELVGKRAFVAEVLEATRLGADIESAGLRQVAASFLDVDYRSLFKEVKQVDIFAVHGSAWLSRNRSFLEEVSVRPGALIRIFLSDPQVTAIIDGLARQTQTSSDMLASRIESSRQEFESLRKSGGAEIETYYYPGVRTHAMYRIGGSAVITFYPHKPGKTSKIPSLVCHEGGALYAFVCSELEAILQISRRC